MVSDKYASELKLALDLHRAGAIKEAATMYIAMLAKVPPSFDLHHYLGMALMQMGQADQALVHLRTAIDLNPKSAAALCNLAVAYDLQGRKDEALAALDQAIVVKPDFAESWVRKAALLHMAGSLDKAVDA